MEETGSIVSVRVVDGKSVPVTTSLKISEVFEKQHKHIIRDIEVLISSGKFNQPNFEPVNYRDKKGESRKMYLLDQKFTTLLIMGFTGSKALDWKIAYYEEFARMKDRLHSLELEKIHTSQSAEPALITVPRFKHDSASQAHLELTRQFTSTFSKIKGRRPDSSEFALFISGVNRKVFSFHEKGMRRQLTPHGYIVAINTFNEITRKLKGSINIGHSVQDSVDKINKELRSIRFPELGTKPFALISGNIELMLA